MVRSHRKIEMVKITNQKNLQVTFSKRKSGLFKKIHQLCILCDAKVALILFSPSGKVYSFGHPNMNGLFDSLSSRSRNCTCRDRSSTKLGESNTNSQIQNINNILTQVIDEKEKEIEKKKRYKIIKNERLNNSENWYQKPPEELNLTQAIQMKHITEDLMKKIDDLHSQFQERFITHQNYHVGSSSSVPPGTVHGGTYYTNHNLFEENRRMGTNAFNYDPNMITTSETLPFGYNHDNNNLSERFVPDCAVNRTPWYDHGQIQSQKSEQGHRQDGPRY